MAKKHTEESSVAVLEETATTIDAEQPKVKVGDAEPTTTVDKPKKIRNVTPKGTKTYRILDGVDISKFAGQRKCVISALQKLAAIEGVETYFSISTIVENVEGLSAKVPVADSVAWHLNAMAKEGVVAASITPLAPAAEEVKG